MKTNATAQKIEQPTPTMTIVKPTLAISEKTEIKPTAEKVEPTEKVKEIITEKKQPTLQELKSRATIVYLLQEKHTKLSEKRTSLDRFAIKHDEDNASAMVTDAHGEEFKSASPKTIGKLIEFWKEEFDEAINEVERELIKTFAA